MLVVTLTGISLAGMHQGKSDNDVPIEDYLSPWGYYLSPTRQTAEWNSRHGAFGVQEEIHAIRDFGRERLADAF